MITTKYKTLNEIFPNWLTGVGINGGIFSVLDMTRSVPWEVGMSLELDTMYHGNHSGDKIISPLLNRLLVNDTLPLGNKTLLATSIVALFGENWTKQWETLSLQYNPIENYDMEEQLTNDTETTTYGRTDTRTNNLAHSKTGNDTTSSNDSTTRTDNLSHSKTGSDSFSKNDTSTRTDNLTETTQPGVTTTVKNDVYGFNSPSKVPESESEESKTGSDSKTNTGTQATTTNGTDSTTYNTTESDTGTQASSSNGSGSTTYNTTETDTGTQTDSAGGTDTKTHNYTLTRKGNIGVTTAQQMIESERALWVWNFFYNVVFPDIDKVLTLQIY